MPYTRTLTRHIAAEPTRVFDVLSDVARYPVWVPNMIRVERQDEGPLSPGSRWQETLRTLKADSVDTTDRREAEIVDRPTRLRVLTLTARPERNKSAISEDYRLRADGSSTVLDATLTIAYGGTGLAGAFSRVIEHLTGPFMARILSEKLDGLQRVMDT